ncbi:MAG: hypothetical protein E5W53_02230, partial [Mesorhizobium sp.]
MRELAGTDPVVMPLMEPLLTILATKLGEFVRLTKQLLGLVRKEEVCRRLMSAYSDEAGHHSDFKAAIFRSDPVLLMFGLGLVSGQASVFSAAIGGRCFHMLS